MVNVIVNNNLDALRIVSLESLMDDIAPVVRGHGIKYDESCICRSFKSPALHNDNTRTDIIQFKGEDIVGLNETWGFNGFHTNPLPSVYCVLFRIDAPILIGKCVDYADLEEMYIKLGFKDFRNYIRINKVKSYRIPAPKHANELLIATTPFEFILIQLGLERVESHPFEPDYLNTLSNEELWNMYNTDKRVRIYEYDILLRRWSEH